MMENREDCTGIGRIVRAAFIACAAFVAFVVVGVIAIATLAIRDAWSAEVRHTHPCRPWMFTNAAGKSIILSSGNCSGHSFVLEGLKRGRVRK